MQEKPRNPVVKSNENKPVPFARSALYELTKLLVNTGFILAA